MKTNKVIINKDTEYQLGYFDWDIDELKQEMPKIFPDAKVIEITDCEDKHIEVNIDGKYYLLDETGKIIENNRM